MDDVTRALERAEVAFCVTTSADGFVLTIGERTRAAVLAFLKAMPPLICEFEDGTTVDTKVLSWLAAAIEEAQG